MTSPLTLRPAIEQRLSLPQYALVWKQVEEAFAAQYWEDERDYWDHALGLRDSWQSMARAPTKQVERTVADIAVLARSLANRILGCSPEIRTLKGYLDIDFHTFMVKDLIRFADDLERPNSPTEAMQSRPRSMALETAERTYIARALTHFILSCGEVSGNPVPARNAVVAMTVNALLDIGEHDEWGCLNFCVRGA